MPLIAIIDGVLVDALDDNVTTAHCRDERCSAPMYRRAGKGMVPHWAHNPGTADRCEADNKVSLWHGNWQLRCEDRSRIEVTHGRRRADVLSRFGWAVEFQHTNLKTADVHNREDDWHGQLIWVHDGTGTVRDDITVHPDGTFRWLSPPSRIGAGRCHQLVDLGDGSMLWLPGIKLPTGGRDLDGIQGRLVEADKFAEKWLNGPEALFPPGWSQSRWQYERKHAPKPRTPPKPQTQRLANAIAAAKEDEDYRCVRAIVPVGSTPCVECGRPLLLVRPGRVQCERCRLAAAHAPGAA